MQKKLDDFYLFGSTNKNLITNDEIKNYKLNQFPLVNGKKTEMTTAINRIKKIMSSADKETIGVRIGVKSGGCAGMSYVMEYAKTINPNEEVIEDKGVKVLIDPKAIIYLIGTEMDYKHDKFSSQFVFKNPNETERCGCGESFKA